MRTYNEIYLKAKNLLRQGGIEDYSFEAKLLLSSVAGKSISELVRDFNLYTTDEIDKRNDEYIKKRLSGEPIAYITGTWEFYGIPLYVSKDVLIPRQDTEVIVDTAKEVIKNTSVDSRVLDLCCGSGCITCALANEFPSSKFVDVDSSAPALEIARKNVASLGFGSKVICMTADALSYPPVGIGMFDVIVSNPPYIPSEEIESLDSSVRDYEPRIALDGGKDGLDFYRAIIKYWKSQLKENGYILFEVGENQSDDVEDMLLSAGFSETDTRLDTINVKRVVIGRL